MKKITIILSAAAFAFLSSCKDDPAPPIQPVTEGVLIANEGAFSGGTGSVTLYNTGAKTTEKNVFQKANFTSAGNLLNEVYVDGERTFLTVNVSGEVIMCNTNTLKVEQRFEDLGSPRKVMHAMGDKYYVTDWTSDIIHILNAKTGRVDGTIVMGTGPESMVKVDDMMYVTNSGGFSTDSTVFVINVMSDMVVDTIMTTDNPQGIVADGFNNLWILCSGIPDFNNPPVNNTAATLMRYSLDSARVEDTLIFADDTKKPIRITTDAAGTNLYFLDNSPGDLYTMSAQDSVLPTTPFQAGNFFGLGFDPVNNEIYVSDPLDFSVNGDVYRFDESGKTVDQFKGGLIPATFGFK